MCSEKACIASFPESLSWENETNQCSFSLHGCIRTSADDLVETLYMRWIAWANNTIYTMKFCYYFDATRIYSLSELHYIENYTVNQQADVHSETLHYTVLYLNICSFAFFCSLCCCADFSVSIWLSWKLQIPNSSSMLLICCVLSADCAICLSLCCSAVCSLFISFHTSYSPVAIMKVATQVVQSVLLCSFLIFL